MDDMTGSLDDVVSQEPSGKDVAAISAVMRAVSNTAGTLFSAGAGYIYFLLEIYTKKVFADPDFALQSLKYSYAPIADAAPVTLGSFIDSNITLAQQNPDAVIVGIVGLAAHYALFRIMHGAMFNSAPKQNVILGDPAY